MATLDQAHHVTEKLSEVATYGGATSAGILWGLQISDIGVIVSVVVAVLGFAVSLWFHITRERREQEQHKLIMEMMRRGASTVDVKASQGNGRSDSGC